MTVLHPVVGIATDLMLVGIAEHAHRCLVGARDIGGDHGWRTMALQRLLFDGERCGLVPAFVT